MHKAYRKLIIINVVFLTFVALVLWKVTVNERKLQNEFVSNNIDVSYPSDSTDIRNASTKLPIPPTTKSLASTIKPTSILIPSINLLAHVLDVGIAKSGNMAVPNSFTDAGWYRYGPTPGQAGNAVMAGHLDNGRGVKAVFYDLNKLKVDDTIYVVNSNGDTVVFKVTEVALYDYDNAPLDKIFGKSDESHLNLITCEGIWNQEKRVYDKRLIIFSKKVKTIPKTEFI
jgi:LPXTG-site transpeptidase (sortase) family protein